jgi:hypothetical protein
MLRLAGTFGVENGRLMGGRAAAGGAGGWFHVRGDIAENGDIRPDKSPLGYRLPMRSYRPIIAGVLVASALTTTSVAGCSSHPKSSTPASGSPTSTHAAQQGDYTQLLIKASDINAPEPFTAGPAVNNPNGQQGAQITFTDQDKAHTIIDTIQILLDPAAAANALDSAKAVHREALLAKPMSVDVGVDGTTISGPSPDHSKGVTMLVFTQGKAFVTLEFDGPSYALAPADFVADVGHKQDDAIKKGLGG